MDGVLSGLGQHWASWSQPQVRELMPSRPHLHVEPNGTISLNFHGTRCTLVERKHM